MFSAFIGYPQRHEHIREFSKHTPLQWLKDFCTILFSSGASIYQRISSIFVLDISKLLNNLCYKLQEDTLGVHYIWFLYLPIHWFVCVPLQALTVALTTIVETGSWQISC